MESFYSVIGFPRLVDAHVLRQAIAEGVHSRTFGHVSRAGQVELDRLREGSSELLRPGSERDFDRAPFFWRLIVTVFRPIGTAEVTTTLTIAAALAKKAGKTLPWTTVREAIDGAVRIRLLETTGDSGPWPYDAPGAQYARLRLPGTAAVTPIPPLPPKPRLWFGEAELEPHEIQSLAEVVDEVVRAAVGYGLKFQLHIELGSAAPPGPGGRSAPAPRPGYAQTGRPAVRRPAPTAGAGKRSARPPGPGARGHPAPAGAPSTTPGATLTEARTSSAPPSTTCRRLGLPSRSRRGTRVRGASRCVRRATTAKC